MSFLKSEKFDKVFEIVIAIVLGITAVLTAYASWQASLYGGNQATKYTKGSAIVGEANAMFTEASQQLSADMSLYNEVNDLRIDLTFAEQNNNTQEAERLSWKLDELYSNNVSEDLAAAIEWSDEQTEYVSPFEMEGLVESYYAEASVLYQEGNDMIADGQKDNSLGDKLGLTTVIYAVVLFMLGVVNTFDGKGTRLAVAGVSFVALMYAFITMLSVPMLTL